VVSDTDINRIAEVCEQAAGKAIDLAVTSLLKGGLSDGNAGNGTRECSI